MIFLGIIIYIFSTIYELFFLAFISFFKSQLVEDICLFQINYLNAHIVDDSDQWNAAIRLMSIVLHNELARHISWKGTKGVKISFYGTRIKEALFCKFFYNFFLFLRY